MQSELCFLYLVFNYVNDFLIGIVLLEYVCKFGLSSIIFFSEIWQISLVKHITLYFLVKKEHIKLYFEIF